MNERAAFRAALFARMISRLLFLALLFIVAALPSGCASVDESSDEQMQTFHTAPEQGDDAHGWGGSR